MAIVLSLCFSYALYCFVTLPAGPITAPDSFHYLSFSPIVPLGYPAFLRLVGGEGAVIVQPIFYSMALAFLGRETLRATRQTALAVAVVVAGMAVPQVAGFHGSILTESQRHHCHVRTTICERRWTPTWMRATRPSGNCWRPPPTMCARC